MLPPDKIIPLPENVEKAREFSKGTEVLAMFPNTTAFYNASVVQPPKNVIVFEFCLFILLEKRRIFVEICR